MEKVTISLTGSVAEVRSVLEVWARIQGEGSTVPAANLTSDVDGFVDALTPDGRAIVRLVAERSARGERLSQAELLELSGARSERELFGLLGGVGIHWRRTRSDANPFRRQWDENAQANYYQVGAELAADVLTALGVVTFVFTDIIGATAKQSELGDQAWEQLMRAYDDAVTGALSQYSGRVVKWLGDGYLLVFGNPLDAVRCVTDIHGSMAGDVDGEDLHFRAGCHFGEAIRRGDDYVGSAVNLAASITRLAGPDELLVSAEVVEALGESSEFTAEALAPTELRGFEGQRVLYRIEAGEL